MMNRRRLLRKRIKFPLVVLFAMPAVACSAMQLFFAPPESTPIPPKSGVWTASAELLGEFVFQVAPDGSTATLDFFHFKQFQCGNNAVNGKWLHGNWWPDTGNTGTIRNGGFAISPQVSGRYQLTFGGSPPDFSLFDTITIEGKFDGTGTRADGIWRAVWAGTTCFGNWKSPKSGAPAAPSPMTTIPLAPAYSGSGFSDAFDNNYNGWFVDDYSDPFVAGSRSIAGGRYHWEVQAYQPSRFTSVPVVDPVSDFYLIVDARRIRGPTGSLYGLIFRRLDRNNCYLFQIKDDQYFAFELLDQDEWTALIGWTKTSAVRPGEVNRLAVRGVGSHFEFFINDEFVGEADNDEFRSGIVGLAVGFSDATEKAVFEFDDFELGTPNPRS